MCDKEFTETEARAMAEAVNGGSWDTDYTEAQKAGWRLKVLWAMERYRLPAAPVGR